MGFWQSHGVEAATESFALAGDQQTHASVGAKEKSCGVVGRPLNANAQPFKVGAKPLNADAKPFEVAGKTLNANAQPFDMGVQTDSNDGKVLNVDAMPFDMGVPSFEMGGQMSGVEVFDSGIGSFLGEDHSLDANAQVFNT